jgi:hypothetical protein
MPNTKFIMLLRYATIGGNILFMSWIIFNGIKEGFHGTLPEKASYVGLMGLLAINTLLLNKPKALQHS